jgi:hypothetical protein
MKSQTLYGFAVLVSLLALVPGPGYAQSQPASTIQPAAETGAPAPPPQAEAAPIAGAKPAKVWTNDDISGLPRDPSVRAAGKNAPQKVSATSKATSNTSSKANPPEKDPAWYRKQLGPLQLEIDKLDAQIAKLNAFLSGEKVSDPPTTHLQMVPTPQDQLKQAEAKRQADVAKMDDLMDRARHNNIEPGVLR